VVCGPDPEKHIEKINKVIEAGYDHVCVHQIGPISRASWIFTGGRYFRVSGDSGLNDL
jgi:hypothetical protein